MRTLFLYIVREKKTKKQEYNSAKFRYNSKKGHRTWWLNLVETDRMFARDGILLLSASLNCII